MPKKGIIFNQKVNDKKIIRARELRSAMTSAERKLWDAVKNRKLENLKFRRQQLIAGFISDFYCDELDLCVEIDGSCHDSAEALEYDTYRDEVFKSLNLKVLRISNEEVLNSIETVMKKILRMRMKPSTSSSRPPSPAGEGGVLERSHDKSGDSE